MKASLIRWLAGVPSALSSPVTNYLFFPTPSVLLSHILSFCHATDPAGPAPYHAVVDLRIGGALQ